MRILAFDTCFDAVSAAAGVRDADGTWCISERFEAIGKGHAEKLLVLVRDVMSEAGLQYADLDRIAVTNGPGGFTGLRAGLAAARGLALASGKPLVALGSLELLAIAAARMVPAADAEAPLVIAADARKGDVFLQFFRSAANPRAIDKAALVPIEAAAGMLPPRCTIAGSGAAAVAEAAGKPHDHRVIDAVSAHARDLIGAATTLVPEGPVVPVYLRPPDAKPQQSARIARSGQ